MNVGNVSMYLENTLEEQQNLANLVHLRKLCLLMVLILTEFLYVCVYAYIYTHTHFAYSRRVEEGEN